MEGGLDLQLRCVTSACQVSSFIGVQGGPQHCKHMHRIKHREDSHQNIVTMDAEGGCA